jgi:hypothetical protein
MRQGAEWLPRTSKGRVEWRMRMVKTLAASCSSRACAYVNMYKHTHSRTQPHSALPCNVRATQGPYRWGRGATAKNIFIYICISLSLYLTIYPSIYLSVYLSFNLSIYLYHHRKATKRGKNITMPSHRESFRLDPPIFFTG